MPVSASAEMYQLPTYLSTRKNAILFGTVLLVLLWVVFLLYAMDFKKHTASRSFRTSAVTQDLDDATYDVGIFSYSATLQEYQQQIVGLSYDQRDLKIAANIKPISYFPLGNLLSNWVPDDTEPTRWLNSVAHPSKGHGLPRFDYMNHQHRNKAQSLREAEQPFIVYNVPELNKAADSAFTTEGLLKSIGTDDIRVEKIVNSNKYMYYSKHNSGASVLSSFPKWTPPQTNVKTSFKSFLGQVRAAQESPDLVDANESLSYYTISAGEGKRLPWIRDALPFFNPTPSFFMVDTFAYKGINCRFGMKGVVAANHYDGKRNFVAMIRGRKRYVLLPPSECSHMELLPRGHPSARHSASDWANIDEMRLKQELYNARATEVVLSMGEVLYIPSYWFHYIISQDASIQCNARSGFSRVGEAEIAACYKP